MKLEAEHICPVNVVVKVEAGGANIACVDENLDHKLSYVSVTSRSASLSLLKGAILFETVVGYLAEMGK